MLPIQIDAPLPTPEGVFVSMLPVTAFMLLTAIAWVWRRSR